MSETIGTSSTGREPADERYRRLIEQSGVGLFQTKTDGRIHWLNTAAARVIGYESPDEFIAAIPNIRQIYVNPARRDELIALLEQDQAVTNFEYEVKRKDGSRRWISITAKALVDEDGHLDGFEGTFFDVTEKKLLEAATRAMSSNLEPAEAVAQFAKVLRQAVPFKQLSLVVIEGDHYRRVVSLSGDATASPLLAGELVPLEGNSVEVVVRSGRSMVVEDTSASRWSYDRVLHDAGVASYAILPLVDDTGVFATFNVGLGEKHGFSEDVLALVQVHIAAVTQAVKNILLYERQREVLKRLEDVDRMKNEFLAGVAHDLRNPVAVIAGAADLLEQSWSELADGYKVQMIRSIKKNAETVYSLLQRDLDLALIERGELRYDIRPTDLGRLVRETVDLFESSTPERKFQLEISEPLASARCDPQRQQQILQNLLSNAIKFSPADSTIVVEVRVGDGHLIVSVADEGPGIDAEAQSRLFERMSRLSSSQPGTGLGLYMARLMVEAQGGSIFVESPGGKGAIFSYTVPLDRSDGSGTSSDIGS